MRGATPGEHGERYPPANMGKSEKARPFDRSALQMQQLDKARQMLARVRGEYEGFPYHD